MTTSTAYSTTPDNTTGDNAEALYLALLCDIQPLLDGVFEGTKCHLVTVPITGGDSYKELQIDWPNSDLNIAIGATTTSDEGGDRIDIAYYFAIAIGEDLIKLDVVDDQTTLLDELEQAITDLADDDMRVATILALTSQDIYEEENGFSHVGYPGMDNRHAIMRDFDYDFESDEWIPPIPGYGGGDNDWDHDQRSSFTKEDGVESYYDLNTGEWVASKTNQDALDDFYTAQDHGEMPDWAWEGL